MNAITFRQRLEARIAASGVPLAALTPLEGLELMLRVYGEDPADGYLTCAWGVVTRYGDEEFGFHLSRSFNPDPDDSRADPPSDVSLIFKVGPRARVGDFSGWMKWVDAPEHLSAFRSAIEESPPFRAWGRAAAAGVVLVCESIESWGDALHDWWGVRDPSRPVIRMTEEEWLRTDDVPRMLRWFRQEWSGSDADLDRLLHRYCLACCRGIWRLLPQEESRRGIEAAERSLAGLATGDELHRAEWLAEGAASRISHDLEPEAIARWCDEVARIPPEELAAMIQSPRPEDDLSPLGLLEHAAYFACYLGIGYPGIQPKESIERYRLFLPAPLLRDVVGNPFRTAAGYPRA